MIVLAMWLPVAVSATLQSFLGFWTLGEALRVLVTFTGVYCVLWTLLMVSVLGRHLRAVLLEVERAEDEGRAPRVPTLRRLPLALAGGMLVYVGFGPIMAYLSLEVLTGQRYSLGEYAYASFGALPSALITLLPIFFRTTDLLGEHLAPRGVRVTLVSLRTKLIVLGLCSPLVVDAVLLMYYLDRTGYVAPETVALWIGLLGVAAAGTWMAHKSLRRSLAPLHAVSQRAPETLTAASLRPTSLDEVGGITASWATMLDARAAAEERLRASQRMEAIGQLTGGVAHDLNNLMTVVLSNLELIRMASADAGVHELTGEALEATDRSVHLTRSLLAFSRRRPLQPRPVDLPDALRRSTKLLQTAVSERVKLVLDLDPATPPALVDARELDHALLNLATNARDAMPSGGALTLRVRPGPVGDVLVEVEDEGVGIPEALRERIFEPFFSTKADAGTGLGLASVLGFAQQSGGALEVSSEEGVGTRFTLRLPAAPLEASAEAPTPISAARVAVRGGRVLLVEDEDAVRRVAERVLRGAGYDVRSAADADEARRLFDAGPPPELLVSDVILSGAVNGPELARELTARDPSLAVLFLSGYPRRELEGRGGHIDPEVALLQKPFTPRALESYALALLAERAAGSAPERAAVGARRSG